MTTIGAFTTRRSRIEAVVSHFANSALHVLRLLMIVAGLAAATITSVIEWQMVGALFARELPFNASLFSGAAVFALETGKLFLIFSYYQKKSLSQSAEAAILYQYRFVRWGLVGMSVICMLLWTTYSLSNPEYETQVAQAELRLKEDLGTKKTQLHESFGQRKQIQQAADSTDAAFWGEQTSFEMNNVVGKTWKGNEFTYNNGKWEDAKRSQSAHQLALERELSTALAKADAEYSAQLAGVRMQLKQSSASQNRVLTGALTVITGGPNYAPYLYTLLAVFLSAAFSAMLESVMLMSFTDLATTYGAVFAAQIEADTEERKARATGRRDSAKDKAATDRFYKKTLYDKEVAMDSLNELQ